MTEVKEKLIEEYVNAPIKKGDMVVVDKKDLGSWREGTEECKVVNITGDDIIIMYDGYCKTIKSSMVIKKSDLYIGVNPIPEHKWHDGMTVLSSTLQFVYSNRDVTWDKDGVKIKGFNFNPYITDKDGNKVYFQRDLCWTLEDKQNFIESLYNDINCGAIVIRYNSDKRVVDTGYEFDVVDGKQRLSTLIEFFNDEFPDKNGNYYSDFSKVAVRQFLMSNKSLVFYVFQENVSDADIKKAFLNVNYTGVPMNKEHLEFVKSINI